MNALARLQMWLFNPFERFAGTQALIAGLVLMGVTIVLCSASGVVMDGVLDAHYGQASVIQHTALVLSNWLLLVALLWIAGKYAGRGRFRLIDLAGTLAVSRWPMTAAVSLTAIPSIRSLSMAAIQAVEAGGLLLPPHQAAILSIYGIVILGLIVWFVALAWKAFRISCDANGVRAALAFTVAMIIAELVSWRISGWILLAG